MVKLATYLANISSEAYNFTTIILPATPKSLNNILKQDYKKTGKLTEIGIINLAPMVYQKTYEAFN